MTVLWLAVFAVTAAALLYGGLVGISLSKLLDEERYLDDCRKYADTLPAFSAETERSLRREGQTIDLRHCPPTTVKFWGHDTLAGKSPASRELMTEPPGAYMRRRYGQAASVRPNNATEAQRQREVLEGARRSKEWIHRPIFSPPHFALSVSRIVREVVEVEEIDVTHKASSETKVLEAERRYFVPIEEPDISQILVDKSS